MALDVVIDQPGQGVPEALDVHFAVVLHHRGTDFHLYKNQWDKGSFTFQPGDSAILRVLVAALMDDESGVHHLEVKNYTLRIDRSIAVSEDDLRARITAALRRLGKPLNITQTRVALIGNIAKRVTI